jgi:hypothetical protein
MVYGVVHRLVRLGDSAECLRDEPPCRRRTNDNQAVHQRVELCIEDERFPQWSMAQIWDAFNGRLVAMHRVYFAVNLRMRVMVSQLDKMSDKLIDHRHLASAISFSSSWSSSQDFIESWPLPSQ